MSNRAARVLIEYQARTKQRRCLNINLRLQPMRRWRTFMLNNSALEEACGTIMRTLKYDYNARLRLFNYYPQPTPVVLRLLEDVSNYFLLRPVPRWSPAVNTQILTLANYIDRDE